MRLYPLVVHLQLLARATMPTVGGALEDLLGQQVGYTWALQGPKSRGQQGFRCLISHICPPSYQEPDLLAASPDTQVRIFFPHDGESIGSPVVGCIVSSERGGYDEATG